MTRKKQRIRKTKRDLVAELRKIARYIRQKDVELTQQQEQLSALYAKIESAQDELAKIEVKRNAATATVAAMASEFKPKDRRITFPRIGTFYGATTYAIKPSPFFLLDRFAATAKLWKATSKHPVTILVNEELLFRLFGHREKRAVNYGGLRFVISHGVRDDTAIFIAKRILTPSSNQRRNARLTP